MFWRRLYYIIGEKYEYYWQKMDIKFDTLDFLTEHYSFCGIEIYILVNFLKFCILLVIYINFFNLDEVRFSSDNMMRIRFDLVPNWNPFLQYSHYYEKLLCVYRMFLAFVLIWILYLKENVLKRIFFVTLWHFWHFFASSLWYSDYKHFLW